MRGMTKFLLCVSLLVCSRTTYGLVGSSESEIVGLLSDGRIAVLTTNIDYDKHACPESANCESFTSKQHIYKLYLTDRKFTSPHDTGWQKNVIPLPEQASPTHQSDICMFKVFDVRQERGEIVILYCEYGGILLDSVNMETGAISTIVITMELSSLGRFMQDGIAIRGGKYVFVDFLVGAELWEIVTNEPILRYAWR